ncbi:PAS domain S-box protein [Magnetovirga frankeli]|uniref:PAS domain-containing hybrid sensor histidine kinase/response regulator n=1 Tax=Magnetovirga frankeli TaxID=947516 RepID=UPI001293E870|nr:PAS domain S-box protein [gamma proteobacterium SS-5]
MSNGRDFTRQRSIFIATVSLLSVSLIALASIYLYCSQERQLISAKKQEMETEAELIGGFLRDYLLRHDYSEARQLLKSWPDTHTEVERLQVVLDNGSIFFSFNRHGTADVMDVQRQLDYAGRSLSVRLGHRVTELKRTLSRLAWELFGLALLMSLFTGLLLWYVLFRWAIKPMEQEIRARTAALHDSEERFRRLAENAQDMIYRMSLPEGRYEYVSPACRRLTGYTPEELYARPRLVEQALHPQWRDYFEREWQALLRGEMAPSYEYQIIHRNGNPRWLHQRNALVRDAQGRPRAIEAIVTDITERKMLVDSLFRYKQIIESTQEAIFLTTPEGRIIDVNEAFCRITGYSAAELAGRVNFLESGEHPPGLLQDMRQQLQETGSWSGELWDRRRNGEAYPKWLSLSAIRNGAGETVSYAGIFTDISERKRAEQELISYRHHLEERVEERTAEMRMARDEAERANRAKSDFLSSMSHELRTPLNAILGFAQLLQLEFEEGGDPQLKQSVSEIIRAGEHLLGLISDLLELTKIETGKVSVQIEDLALHSLLQECIDLLGGQLEANQLTLDRGDVCDQPRYVRADRARLKQVVLNLLSNAIKYNHQGGWVQLYCSPMRGGRLRLVVADSGRGIALESQGKLFIPFERLGAERSTVLGAGIGLVVSKKLIELMQGEIGFQSTPGQGSTFWIELPLGQEPPTPQLPEPPPQSDCCTSGSACCCRVLYVQDDPADIRLARRILEQLGSVELVTAHTGPLGLQLAKQYPCQLILIDINLRGLDGLDLVGQLRQLPGCAQVPMVAISADGLQGDIDRTLAAGFDHFVTKPIDLPWFKQLIAELLPKASVLDPQEAG